MKERTITPSNLNEIDKLEQQYALQNKKVSIGIKSRISDTEKVVFCYYGLNRTKDIDIYLLTDMKFMFVEGAVGKVFPLDKIIFLKVENLFVLPFKRTKCLQIEGWDILEDVNQDLLQNMVDSILKAKANYESRLLNPTDNIKQTSAQNSIASQLEKLTELHKAGALTDDEYKRAKESVISKN